MNEYRYEIERLTRELQDLKKKYYESKRRDQLAKEAILETNNSNHIKHSRAPHHSLEAQQAMNARQAVTRFTGGGFAIK